MLKINTNQKHRHVQEAAAPNVRVETLKETFFMSCSHFSRNRRDSSVSDAMVEGVLMRNLVKRNSWINFRTSVLNIRNMFHVTSLPHGPINFYKLPGPDDVEAVSNSLKLVLRWNANGSHLDRSFLMARLGVLWVIGRRICAFSAFKIIWRVKGGRMSLSNRQQLIVNRESDPFKFFFVTLTSTRSFYSCKTGKKRSPGNDKMFLCFDTPQPAVNLVADTFSVMSEFKLPCWVFWWSRQNVAELTA